MSSVTSRGLMFYHHYPWSYCGMSTSINVSVVEQSSRFINHLINWHVCSDTWSKIDLTRLPSKTTSSRWQVDKEAIGLLSFQQFFQPALIRCMPISFLNIFALLVLTQSFDSLFHSFITFCENEDFLMSNLLFLH